MSKNISFEIKFLLPMQERGLRLNERYEIKNKTKFKMKYSMLYLNYPYFRKALLLTMGDFVPGFKNLQTEKSSSF